MVILTYNVLKRISCLILYLVQVLFLNEIDDKMLIIVFECNDIWRIKYFE